MKLTVREISEGRGSICEAHLRALPKWFGIDLALRNYVAEVETMPMYGAFQGDRVAGFVSLHTRNEATTEVHVMAVMPEFHRQGVGRVLIDTAVDRTRARGGRLLSVKTVGPSRENIEYRATRRFYLAQGFLPVEEFPTLWGTENPCRLLVKIV